MSTPSSLPQNWTVVLEHIQQTLTQATQLAEAREAGLAGQAIPAASLFPPDQLTKYLAGLDKRLQQIQAPLDAFDQALQNEEEHVRRHLVTVADLRQRLADWGKSAMPAR